MMMKRHVRLLRRSRRVILVSSPRCPSYHSTPTSLHTFKSSYGLWIDGKEVESISGERFSVENPATTEVITQVVAAGPEDVHRAVQSGTSIFDRGVWSRADVRHRYQVLHRLAQGLRQRLTELAHLESLQTGRAVREMKAQLGRLPEWFEYFGALVRTQQGTVPPFFGPYLNYVQRVPLGVVGHITPWNHPLLIAIKKIAPALAAGNSIVVKPSELAPLAVLELGKIAQQAGVPDGVLNIIPGYGAVTGQALVQHPHIKKIDLTGGTDTGRVVASMAGKNLASVIAELGGKTPMVVFDDAELQQAVNTCAFGSFVATGQTCVTGSRLLVHQSVYEEVKAMFVSKAQSIRLGDPMDHNTQMGPLASKGQLDRVRRYVDLAKSEGAKVLCGGRSPSDLPLPSSRGYYYEPTVIGQVTPNMRIVQEEVFGPVVCVYSFKDEEEAVRLANDSPYGLAATIWTKDIKKAHRVADRLNVGIIWINDHHRNDPSSPWGGMKDSGIGRENGIEAYHQYTQTKSVVVATSSEPFDWFEQTQARYS